MLKILILLSGLFVAALLSSCAHTAGDTPAATAAADTPPVNGYPDPASACLAAGGKKLDDLKCRHADGSNAPNPIDAAAQRIMASGIPVAPKSPHAWALATTAILFEMNGHRHDLLSGAAATPDGQESGKRVLSQWWGVNNHDELLRALNWLQFEGHRAEFDELGRRVDALSDSEFRSIIIAADNNAQAANQLDITRRNYRRLGHKGILAWDIVRYIALCRWGYLAGYFTDTEAWDHIMPAASRLQLSFDSWQDLQSDFLIGREYWSVQQTENNGPRFRAIYERFLQDPGSPWNANPWGLDLKVPSPLPLVAN
jgi:hypothetical protein